MSEHLSRAVCRGRIRVSRSGVTCCRFREAACDMSGTGCPRRTCGGWRASAMLWRGPLTAAGGPGPSSGYTGGGSFVPATRCGCPRIVVRTRTGARRMSPSGGRPGFGNSPAKSRNIPLGASRRHRVRCPTSGSSTSTETGETTSTGMLTTSGRSTSGLPSRRFRLARFGRSASAGRWGPRSARVFGSRSGWRWVPGRSSSCRRVSRPIGSTGSLLRRTPVVAGTSRSGCTAAPHDLDLALQPPPSGRCHRRCGRRPQGAAAPADRRQPSARGVRTGCPAFGNCQVCARGGGLVDWSVGSLRTPPACGHEVSVGLLLTCIRTATARICAVVGTGASRPIPLGSPGSSLSTSSRWSPIPGTSRAARPLS